MHIGTQGHSDTYDIDRLTATDRASRAIRAKFGFTAAAPARQQLVRSRRGKPARDPKRFI